MSPEGFSVSGRTGSTAGTHILSVTGAITYSCSPAFQQAVAAVTAPRLIIDLSAMPSLDSSAIGALVRAYVSCQKSGRKLAFVGVNHRVKNVLEITGVAPLFDTYSTIAEAESSLN